MMIVTLAQRLVILAPLRGIVTLAHWRDSWMDRMIAPVFQSDISHTIDDLTPQQSGDTSEDSHVLAPRDDELPMVTMTHMSSFQTPMTATSHEDSSGMSNMMEEPYMRDTHQRHMDPQIQDEIQDVQTVDLTHTDQHEEIESQLLETPLVEKIVDTDRLMGHLLPRIDLH
jgi:hypothetical protein